MALRRFDGKEFDALPSRVRHILHHPWKRSWRRWVLGPGARRKLNAYLDKRGLITPHFSWAEAASNPGHGERGPQPVPAPLRRAARRHAWNLERLRHRLGNEPLGFLSWYRTQARNRQVGGASQSRHMSGDATDLTPSTIARIGRARLMKEANIVFAKGGVGDYPSGAVHVDSRGFRARWSSF